MMSVSMDEDLADTIEEVNEIAEEKDATTEESIDVTTKYVELQQLFEAHPEFFGRTAPYFTSKETTGRKIDALLSLTQYGYDQENDQFLTEELSMEEIAGMVQAYTNTLQLCMAYLGESFMAALSVALGLADIVQNTAGAVSLETMFVDEGFGSLDDASRERAIQILKELAGEKALVGIISHVNELKEQIDWQLKVTKGERGSHARWNI